MRQICFASLFMFFKIIGSRAERHHNLQSHNKDVESGILPVPLLVPTPGIAEHHGPQVLLRGSGAEQSQTHREKRLSEEKCFGGSAIFEHIEDCAVA